MRGMKTQFKDIAHIGCEFPEKGILTLVNRRNLLPSRNFGPKPLIGF
jgi:hypothetical protein